MFKILKTSLDRLLAWRGNPWHLARFGEGGMRRLHCLASRHAITGRFRRWAWIVKLMLTLTWPLRLAAEAWPLLRRHGGVVETHHGRSLLRQVLDLAYLGAGFGLPPLAYYQLRLFRKENRARLADYLYDHEVRGLFSSLNDFSTDPAVEDKRLFAERCAAAGLACVPTVAWGAHGVLRWSAEVWPEGDLVSKPAGGCKGRGVVLWCEVAPGRYRADGEDPMARAALLDRLVEASAGDAWLLQPALINHPAVADLTPGPLVGARIMTARGRNGGCEAFAAILKMPVGRQRINNHGLGSAIDLERGTLGPAFLYRPLDPGRDRHPDTDGTITGRMLPDWKEGIRLVLAAHDLFPRMRLLGWDVAFTPEGPVLLETNAGWDVTMPQIAMQRPLGETRLVALCDGVRW